MKKEIFPPIFQELEDKVHYSKVIFSYGPWKFKTPFGTAIAFYLISADAN